MTDRATALALALLLLAAGASAAPGACCPSNPSAEQRIRSVDCCESMLEGTISPPAALATAIRGLQLFSADQALLAGPPPAPASPRLSVARTSRGAFPGGEPLYRLHSQLLI